MNRNETTLKELSKQYDISIKDLRAFVNQGALSAAKVGRSYRVKKSDADIFMKSDIVKNRRKKTGPMPERNYLCGNYDVCLNKAAAANEMFGCEGCHHFIKAERRTLYPHELAGVAALWESVFGRHVCLT